MHSHVYIGGQRIKLNPSSIIGSGGEADVYSIGKGLVVKIFKTPDHPTLGGDPIEMALAKSRIDEHQTKLAAFPKGLPKTVITPIALATNKKGNKVYGYVMPFLANAEALLNYHRDRNFRRGIPGADSLEIFKSLHGTVEAVHGADVVIGDFNDLNVLVHGKVPYILDADSMQYGSFVCRMFTGRFVDPVLCDPNETKPILAKPHGSMSDWYAFNVMLFEHLLLVHPFGGVFKPKDKARRSIKHDERALRGVTVFDAEVKYPKKARHFSILPDDLLQEFHRVFEDRNRNTFPIDLLRRMRWTACSGCGAEHARATCPICAVVTPAAIKHKITVRGNVTSTRIFPHPRGCGKIMHSCIQDGKLKYVYHENGRFKREDGSDVIAGVPDPKMRFRISRSRTFIGAQSRMIVAQTGNPAEVIDVDRFGPLPTFDTNADHVYWMHGGMLNRDTPFGVDAPEFIGRALTGQTMFWTGSAFGFGFYRAGALFQAFVFDAKGRRSMNDNVSIPPIKGNLIGGHCAFSSQRCWFFTTTEEAGILINRCYVITKYGDVEALIEEEAKDGSWLNSVRGSCAVTLPDGSGGALHALFVPTDEGVVMVEASTNSIGVTKEYETTEPFVDSDMRLYFANGVIFTVGSHEIHVLKIK